MYICGKQLYMSRSLSGRRSSTHKGNNPGDLLPVYSPRRRDEQNTPTAPALLLLVVLACSTISGLFIISNILSSSSQPDLKPHRPLVKVEKLSPLPVHPVGQEISFDRLQIPRPNSVSESETYFQQKLAQVTHRNSRRSHGEVYYFNVKTQESQWKHPVVDSWKMVVTGIGHDQRERYFYQNMITGDISWSRPRDFDWAAAFATTRSEL